MALEWTTKIAVGVDLIDDQHKELFDRTNRLLETCRSGGSEDEVIKSLSFLEEYVAQHLKDEEDLQRDHNYPDYKAHKEQHQIFLQKVAEIKADIDSRGATLVNVIKTTNLFVSWLSKHISQEDKKLGEFLTGKV
ncbi:MAG: bacteriohemerythrin [Leptospirales bacterium]